MNAGGAHVVDRGSLQILATHAGDDTDAFVHVVAGPGNYADLTPNEARQEAAKLLEAADHADRMNAARRRGE